MGGPALPRPEEEDEEEEEEEDGVGGEASAAEEEGAASLRCWDLRHGRKTCSRLRMYFFFKPILMPRKRVAPIRGPFSLWALLQENHRPVLLLCLR